MAEESAINYFVNSLSFIVKFGGRPTGVFPPAESPSWMIFSEYMC